MIYLSAFIVSLIFLFAIRNYWIAFAVAGTIYIIGYFVILISNAPEGATFNSSAIPSTIGEALGIFILPFLGARLVHGMTTKKEKPNEADNKTDKEATRHTIIIDKEKIQTP